MSPRPKRKRNDKTRLKNPLERRITDYSLAAVGIGAVSFAPTANAAVVTTGVINQMVPATNTPSAVVVGTKNVMAIDNYYSGSSAAVTARVGTANSALIWAPGGAGGFGGFDASAFNGGQNIPGAISTTSRAFLAISTSSSGKWTGFVGNTKYLGFSFHDSSGIHYGWVELNISQSGPHTAYVVTMVQAAYETVAGKPIPAGATTDNSGPSETPVPNSLWLMTLGAAGIAGLEVIRRKRTAQSRSIS